MAVTVVEFGGTGGFGTHGPVVNSNSVLASQSLTIGGAASAAFDGGTSIVEIDSDTACRVEFGAAPVGTGKSFYVPAATPRQFGVKGGQKVIAVSA